MAAASLLEQGAKVSQTKSVLQLLERKVQVVAQAACMLHPSK